MGIVKQALAYPMSKGFDLFDIDLTMLDKEWIEHPKIFFRFSIELVNARREMEETKSDLDLVKARLDRIIRKDPDTYKIEKITEAAVAYTILTRPKYKKALKAFNKAKYKVDVIQCIVTALDHRRRGLERLVSLHGQSYFAEPRPLDERSKVIAAKIVKQSARMATRKRKRKRKNDD
jgi:hypothetical protein